MIILNYKKIYGFDSNLKLKVNKIPSISSNNSNLKFL